jgi:Ni,Fe-hydrogenase III small subunit
MPTLRNLQRLRRDLPPGPTRGRAPALRHVDAGLNGCEHELTLTAGPHYDLARFGFAIVASPRHADVLLVTGTVTTRMHAPLLAAYNAMPEPRRVIALGDCALGCGVLGRSSELAGRVEDILPVNRAYPAAHPHRRRSHKRCSNCTTPATACIRLSSNARLNLAGPGVAPPWQNRQCG